MDELVFISEKGNAITDSLLIAKKFKKEHKDVIESIKNLMAENSAETHNQIFSMFYESYYEIELNNGTCAKRRNKKYIMNRDGFSLLVMGFTGKKALKFKLDYIDAFNKMESYIKELEYNTVSSQSLPQDYLSALKALVVSEEQKQIAEAKNKQLEEKIEKDEPKVEYYEEVLQSVSTYTTTQIAKELGFESALKLNMFLSEKGVQFRQSGQWMLTAKYAGKGYTKTKTYKYKSVNKGDVNTIPNTVWTEKGRKFIRDFYRKNKPSN